MMNTTALSLEQTPPLSVPLRYFLTAPLFAMLAALLLLWYGPVALSSRWTPQLLAATHLLTLGFLAMVMFGAVQQLLPILMASPICQPGLSSAVIHSLLSTGTLLLGLGLLKGLPVLFHGALVTLGAAVLLFILLVSHALLRARSSHATVGAMALAVAALGVTCVVGVMLAAGYAVEGHGVPRRLTDLHLVWGLLGWVGLLVIAVAYQVVPMFQLTPNYPPLLMRWLAGVLFAALLIWSAARALPVGEPWARAGAAVLVAGYTVFAVVTLSLQHRCRRRLADISVDFWRVALISLLLAMLLLTAAPFKSSAVADLALGVLLIAGFAMSVISGMLYKIVPFLVWLHLNNRMQEAGRWEKIPNMKEIISPRRARWQFRLQLAALLLLLVAVVWPQPFTRPAALLLAGAHALLGWNLLEALRIYRRYPGSSPAVVP